MSTRHRSSSSPVNLRPSNAHVVKAAALALKNALGSDNLNLPNPVIPRKRANTSDGTKPIETSFLKSFERASRIYSNTSSPVTPVKKSLSKSFIANPVPWNAGSGYFKINTESQDQDLHQQEQY